LTIVCYSSPNTNWRCTIKRKIIIGFLSLALILLLVIPTACVAKRATDSSPSSSSSSSIEQDITSIQKDIKELKSKIASLPTSSGSNYDSDIEALQGDIDNLYTEIENLNEELYNVLDEIETMLADWEEEQVAAEEEEEELVKNITRWYLEATSSDDNVSIVESHSPSRIEEADTYDVRLVLANSSTNSIDFHIFVDLIPKDSSTKTYIDERNTWLDTVNSPYYMWDTDVSTRGDDKHTRRISFESDPITLPAEESTELKLELNLEYET